jgi:hypothetical protein
MKCRECEPLIEEYLDGELDRRAAEGVAAHLASCAACAGARDAAAAEGAFYAAYEREVEVTPQLWGGIEARIRAGRGGVGEASLLRRISDWLAPLLTAPRFSPALTGALVVVAVLATAGAMSFRDSRAGGKHEGVAKQIDGGGARSGGGDVNGSRADAAIIPAQGGEQIAADPTPDRGATPGPRQQQQQSSPDRGAPREEYASAAASPKKGIGEKLSPAPDVSDARIKAARFEQAKRVGEQSPDQLVREAEKRYQAAIKILERDVKNRRTQFDRETLARFDETLTSIDRTIAETRKAVRQQSSDPVAVQYMLSAYAKKVEVMREMAHLGNGN